MLLRIVEAWSEHWYDSSCWLIAPAEVKLAMLKSRGIVSSVRIVDRELDATIFDSLLELLLLDIMTELLSTNHYIFVYYVSRVLYFNIFHKMCSIRKNHGLLLWSFFTIFIFRFCIKDLRLSFIIHRTMSVNSLILFVFSIQLTHILVDKSCIMLHTYTIIQ